MKGLDILAGLTDIPASMIDAAAAPADVLAAHGYGESAKSKKKQKAALVFSSGWLAAAVSAVVAITVVVLIVLAGRNTGGPVVPVGNPTEESGTRAPDSALFSVRVDTINGSVGIPGWHVYVDLKFDIDGFGVYKITENEQSIVLSVGGRDIPVSALRDVTVNNGWHGYSFDIPADCPAGWADLVVTFRGETFTVPNLVEIVPPYAVGQLRAEWTRGTCENCLPGAMFSIDAVWYLPDENGGEARKVVPEAVLTACGSGTAQTMSMYLPSSYERNSSSDSKVTFSAGVSEPGWYDLTLVVGTRREVFPHAVKVVDESELGPFDFTLSFDDCGGTFAPGDNVDDHIRMTVKNLGIDFSISGNVADLAPTVEIRRDGRTCASCNPRELDVMTTENFSGGTEHSFPQREADYVIGIGSDWPAGDYDVVLSYRGSSKTFSAAIHVTTDKPDDRQMQLPDGSVRTLTCVSRAIPTDTHGNELTVYRDEYDTEYSFDSKTGMIREISTSGSSWKNAPGAVSAADAKTAERAALVRENVRSFFRYCVTDAAASMFDNASVSYDSGTGRYRLRTPVSLWGYATMYTADIYADAAGHVLEFNCTPMAEMLWFTEGMTAETLKTEITESAKREGIPYAGEGGSLLLQDGGLYLEVYDSVRDYDSVETEVPGGPASGYPHLRETVYYIPIRRGTNK